MFFAVITEWDSRQKGVDMKKEKRFRKVILTGLLAAAPVFFLAACGGVNTAAIEQDFTRVEMAIDEAQEIDAAEHAPLELKLARDHLEAAREAFDNEDYGRARRLADEAMVDAKLAEAKARTAKTEKAVQELRESIETLQQELFEAES
jgi:hypothetical protein